MWFAGVEIALYQHRERLFIGAGRHRLGAGHQHPAVSRTGQGAVGAAIDGHLEVIEHQCRTLEELGIGEADRLLLGQAIDPLGGQVDKAHPALAVTDDDCFAKAVEQGVQRRGFQQGAENLAADADR
ncbi:hypothetical protein D3C81_1891660 [compost metagenome]